MNDTKKGIVLSKYCADCGICSRRNAAELIKKNYISVNDEIILDPSFRVQKNDVVRYQQKIIRPEKKVYVIMNKPAGVVTTVSDPHAQKTVINLLDDKRIKERIVPVGRLDKDTTGLLLLTNDGDLALRLTHPRYEIKKIYDVLLDKPLMHEAFHAVKKGIKLFDGFIKVDAIYYKNKQNKKNCIVELHSGRNRIVRRIFEHFGLRVKKLDRISYAGLSKKNMPRGSWRFLTESEITAVKSL